MWLLGCAETDIIPKVDVNYKYNNLTPRFSTKSVCTHNLVVDSGCSGHYLKSSQHTTNTSPCHSPYNFVLPNGQTIQATHTTTLPLQELPVKARQAYIIPGLHKYSLLSIGQLCQHGCQALFTATNVQIFYKNKVVLLGYYDKKTCLYHTSIPILPSPNMAPIQNTISVKKHPSM